MRGLAAAGAALALVLAPATARADMTYHPSAADFADCPALPADAVAGTWNCTAMTTLSATVQLNKEGTVLTSPMRVTVAQGDTTGRGTVVLWGGISGGGPLPMVYGLAGTSFSVPEPNGWQVTFKGANYGEPGWVIPKAFGLKAQITGTGLGDDCLIGNDAQPVVLRPQIQWVLPTVIDGVGLVEAGTSSIFAMPDATGCGTLANQLLVDTFVSLPAPATADHLYATWAVRIKKY